MVEHGDRILVGNRWEDWRCIWYFGKKSEYVGWLPASAIEVRPDLVAADRQYYSQPNAPDYLMIETSGRKLDEIAP